MAVEFSNVDEVEFIFGETYTYRQKEMIQHYIDTGERPPATCAWCDEGFVRIVTGNMDIFIGKVNLGLEKWPWPIER